MGAHLSVQQPAVAPAALEAGLRRELIRQSHERCVALGLRRIGRPDHEPWMHAELAEARERNCKLLGHAAAVMELLLEQITGTHSMIVLTDAHGTVLHTAGDRSIVERTSRLGLIPGSNWAEHSQGTNAIGTALFAERPTLVHADEHFMHANQFLTCSASPIFDPRGNVLGVLDVTADHRSYHQHTMGLTRMSARMIENHWLNDHCANRLRLHFHSRPEFIDTLLEGIVVVGADGKLVGANRSALDQLGISGVALRNQTLSALFGITLEAVLDHFRSRAATPVKLRLPDKRELVARARMARTVPSTSSVPAGMPLKRDSVLQPPATGLAYLQTGDPQIEAVVQKARRIINRDIPLLILGETGTGKELLAHAVHQESNRAKQPFVAVNCASIPESLIEAELFGYEEGAFTGARRKGATGRIVQANGGTLFLDEIGDMPLPLQARLLRVLQERCVTPLGSGKSIAVDIAVIGATHRNLREMIQRGEFREDLYYRLNGLVLRLPPLRERSDLPLVAQRILANECPQGAPRIGAEVMALFQRCDWPGNIRQLANVLRTAAVMAAGEPQITQADLPDDFLEEFREKATRPALGPLQPVSEPHELPAVCTIRQHELMLISAALEATGGNISSAAKRLGISRTTIYRRMNWNGSTRAKA